MRRKTFFYIKIAVFERCPGKVPLNQTAKKLVEKITVSKIYESNTSQNRKKFAVYCSFWTIPSSQKVFYLLYLGVSPIDNDETISEEADDLDSEELDDYEYMADKENEKSKFNSAGRCQMLKFCVLH